MRNYNIYQYVIIDKSKGVSQPWSVGGFQTHIALDTGLDHNLSLEHARKEILAYWKFFNPHMDIVVKITYFGNVEIE